MPADTHENSTDHFFVAEEVPDPISCHHEILVFLWEHRFFVVYIAYVSSPY